MNDTDNLEKIAFTMQLYPGQTEEYQKRHDNIWPELSKLLTQAGVRDYSIHLDTKSHKLFAVLWRVKNHKMDKLPEHPVMQRWWAYMADIMVTKADAKGLISQANKAQPSLNEPVITPLTTVFHMM
jgi:L-rhamnose mutarotase